MKIEKIDEIEDLIGVTMDNIRKIHYLSEDALVSCASLIESMDSIGDINSDSARKLMEEIRRNEQLSINNILLHLSKLIAAYAN